MYSPGVLYGVRTNSEEFPLEAAISQVTVKGKKLYTVILRDITVRKQTEAALLRSEKLALLGRMAATIAHEINNPLEAIEGLLYLAELSRSREATTEYLASAREEVRRATEIAKATLGFSRGGGTATRFRPIEVLESILRLLEHKFQTKSVVCERDYLTDAEIFGVESEIRQVLWNLLNNSLDAVPTGGYIKVRVSSNLDALHSPGVRITVADNGHGIPANRIPQLFEPFFTTKVDGNGIGLWVVSEIVKKHRGSIRVRSRTNQTGRTGTVFMVLLPAESVNAGDAGRAADATSNQNLAA